MVVTKKYVVFVILLSSIVSNAQNGTGMYRDTVSMVNTNDTVITSSDLNTNYSYEYENALKRKEELSKMKKTLNDSIKIWNKELKKLEGLHVSLVKSNGKLDEKISQAKLKEQKSGYPELMKKREQLLKAIETEEKEKALLESQLQEIDSKLDNRNHQRENLGKIKDNVTNQIITENQGYLSRPFSEMNLSELISIKEKCQKYTTDVKVNAFVAKIDNVIKNKKLYDNMFLVVNSSYKKNDVDRALASTNQIKSANSLQMKEINDLKTQLSLFPDGLAAFKEFISKLNEMRNGVNYSMEYYQTDSKQILSKNNLESRIETKLKKVPYLNKKFEEFMKAFQAAPNSHSNIEVEILNQ